MASPIESIDLGRIPGVDWGGHHGITRWGSALLNRTGSNGSIRCCGASRRAQFASASAAVFYVTSEGSFIRHRGGPTPHIFCPERSLRFRLLPPADVGWRRRPFGFSFLISHESEMRCVVAQEIRREAALVHSLSHATTPGIFLGDQHPTDGRRRRFLFSADSNVCPTRAPLSPKEDGGGPHPTH